MGKLHCLSVGCADTSILKTVSKTYIIDCCNIQDHTNLLPRDKIITALFITHQHYDHFSGIQYLLDNNYTIKYLIHSPYIRRNNDASVEAEEWRDFSNFKDKLEKSGTKVYSPYRQNDFSKPWWKPEDDLEFWMIGPQKGIAESNTRELHDACLVFVAISSSGRKCLFTGDASDTNLEWIAKNTKNYCNDILHASHHGSINGAQLDFIKKANAKYTLISTKLGVYPSVPDETALRHYRENTSIAVYRTDVNGSKEFDF